MNPFVLTEGACMRPLIKSGAAVPIDRSVRDFRAGDIVLYAIGAKTMLHRIWWAGRLGFWVKDDAGMVSIHRIERGAILGRADLSSGVGSGLPGLLFSLINNAVFMIGRRVRAVLISAW